MGDEALFLVGSLCIIFSCFIRTFIKFKLSSEVGRFSGSILCKNDMSLRDL